MINCNDNFVMVNIEFFFGCIDDVDIGLMWDQLIDI